MNNLTFKVDFTYSNFSIPDTGVVIILTSEEQLNKKSGESNIITDFYQNTNFKANIGELFVTTNQRHDGLIILAGLGKESLLSDIECQKLGSSLVSKLISLKIDEASIIVQDLESVSDNSQSEVTENIISHAKEISSNIALGIDLKNYRFKKYIASDKRKKEVFSIKTINFRLENPNEASESHQALLYLYEGIITARDLVSEPANILTTETYAEYCKKLVSYGLKIEVLGEEKMEKLGMGALLAVGQGSKSESKLIIITWNGLESKNDSPIVFVGKGVVYDTGGLSLKPSKSMETMKCDMAGSAAVVGAMKTLALRKAKVNAIGIIGVVENTLSSTAQRPGDIVTSMSGQTIEVLNTDAEGRLVLADCLFYANAVLKPKIIVNLATLTGAIVMALSDIYAGLFSNSDELADQLYKSGLKSDELLWRLPLKSDYDKMIDSSIADMQNISSRSAGSITAAQFLQRFVTDDNKKVKWAHLDIAGVAGVSTYDMPLVSKDCATGFGVKLLNQLVIDYYEQ